jgi:hypothetical protein
MALRHALIRHFLFGALLTSCSSESSGRTEVFVSIDAIGAARQASSVRIQVDEVVVELPREEWPLEVLVAPSSSTRAHDFELRAFGLRAGQVLGAAEEAGRFKSGARTELTIALDPSTDAGALPEINARVGENGIARSSAAQEPMDGGTELRPDTGSVERDAADGTQDASAARPGDAAASEGGAADAGASACGATSCDAGPACVPSPDDCGVCGNVCPAGQQCIDDQCKIAPPSNCSSYEDQTHTYLVCTDARSWSAARDACQGFSGQFDLVRIESSAENAFIRSVISGAAWIGADDRGDNGSNCHKSGDEGTWTWVNPTSGDERGPQFCALTSSSATTCAPTGNAYTNWRAGEPDNKSCTCGLLGLFPCNDGDDCATISASDGAWADSQCNVGRGYVCEAY